MSVLIRDVTSEDAASLSQMIQELANFEGNYEKLGSTPSRLHDQIASRKPRMFHGVIAECDGALAGFAIYFGYTTWDGAPTLYLEDLYVREAHRKSGIGRTIMEHLAAVARRNNSTRFEWVVLDSNTPAICFYDDIGAKPVRSWTRYRLDESGIEKLLQGEADARQEGSETTVAIHPGERMIDAIN